MQEHSRTTTASPLWVLAATTLSALFLAGCQTPAPSGNATLPPDASRRSAEATANAPDSGKRATAVLAGGCFWCVEAPFEKVPGVKEVISGFTGGPEPNPTYKAVASGQTGHTEAVEIHYDPTVVTYDELLDIFWRQIDPTDSGGQFVDRGSQYRTGIFVTDPSQRRIAEASKARLAADKVFEKPIVTEITEFEGFTAAGDYHQDFYKKKPDHYKRYRAGSGRDQFLAKTWPASPNAASKRRLTRLTDAELKARLTPLEYEVTQRDGTERPFTNKYADHDEPGLYVDIVSGEPLFSSRDKFHSKSGWPSFTKPLKSEFVQEKKDQSAGMVRVEVRSKEAGSHLGHVFEDGPAPTGLRYCINSASLRFVPVATLEKQGYGEFKNLFKAP